jgi:hypothetical protein
MGPPFQEMPEIARGLPTEVDATIRELRRSSEIARKQ